MSIGLPSALLIPISIVVPLLYLPLGRPWIISNLLGVALSSAAMQIIKLDSFLTAFVLLSALLVYDIFWVFGTPVMVGVAKGIDAPIKILAPKPGPNAGFAMLGLGDIVLPGLAIALCLRFDFWRHNKKNPEVETTKYTPFSRPYFWTGIASFIVGLSTTMGVMHHFKAAQPALLYLSPACSECVEISRGMLLTPVIGPLLCALVRGELSLLWEYTEAKKEDEKKEDDTIESASEVAMKARQAARADTSDETTIPSLGAEVSVGPSEEKANEAMDDSWMEDTTGVASGVESTKAKKRKGGKKK